MRVERKIEIGAPPERVYEVVMDPQQLDDWVTIHDSLEEAPDGELRQGSELTQCLRMAGRKFRVHWKVVADDRPHRVVWEGEGPLHARARATYDLAGDGSSTSFGYLSEWSMPGGPLGRMAGRAFQKTSEREADRSLAKLKKLLER